MKKPFFSGPLTGWHVLAILLGFFAVILLVNGYFIYQAQRTWPGVQSKTAYEDGLAYNKTLDQAAAQKALGLEVDMTLTRTDVTLTLKNRDGLPLSGLAPRATLSRPANADLDQTVNLADMGNGRYAAILDLPQAGQWDLRVDALLADGEPFRLEERFILP